MVGPSPMFESSKLFMCSRSFSVSLAAPRAGSDGVASDAASGDSSPYSPAPAPLAESGGSRATLLRLWFQLGEARPGLLHVQACLNPLEHGADHLSQGALGDLLVRRAARQQEHIVDLAQRLQEASAVDDDLVVQHGGEQRLDDLQLDLDGRRLALEAVADGIDGPLDEGLAAGGGPGRHGRGGEGEVRVRDELADGVEAAVHSGMLPDLVASWSGAKTTSGSGSWGSVSLMAASAFCTESPRFLLRWMSREAAMASRADTTNLSELMAVDGRGVDG